MGVHPDHRRRGVGSMLVQWGIDKADSLGLESAVEASDQGRYLYEGFYFRALLCVAINMTKKNPSDTWSALASQMGTPNTWFMWRPSKGDWESPGRKTPWEIGVGE